MKRKIKKIAVLTGGGDCPGLNAVIRSVVKKSIHEHKIDVVGIEDGFEGLIQLKTRKLENHHVSGILTQGGTILGTSNKADPYKYAISQEKKVVYADLSKKVIQNIRKLDIDCLICIGGDGTLHIANRLFSDGVPVIGIPKTIDNDIIGTDISFGFNTAVQIATEGIDRIHTTAQSHHRVMIVEVMGRNAGWIALHAGMAGGGDIILIPEIPYDIQKVVKRLNERNRSGKKFSIIVVAEGAKPIGGEKTIRKIVKESPDPVRLGGISFVLNNQIEKMTKIETRMVVMGHLLRGGTPTAFDRVLATQLGAEAVRMMANKNFGYMVGVQKNKMIAVSLSDVAKGQRLVSHDNSSIHALRSMGISFGN